MKLVLGPVPCHKCRRLVYWNGWEWTNWRPLRGRHFCEGRAAWIKQDVAARKSTDLLRTITGPPRHA